MTMKTHGTAAPLQFVDQTWCPYAQRTCVDANADLDRLALRVLHLPVCSAKQTTCVYGSE